MFFIKEINLGISKHGEDELYNVFEYRSKDEETFSDEAAKLLTVKRASRKTWQTLT